MSALGAQWVWLFQCKHGEKVWGFVLEMSLFSVWPGCVFSCGLLLWRQSPALINLWLVNVFTLQVDEHKRCTWECWWSCGVEFHASQWEKPFWGLPVRSLHVVPGLSPGLQRQWPTKIDSFYRWIDFFNTSSCYRPISIKTNWFVVDYFHCIELINNCIHILLVCECASATRYIPRLCTMNYNHLYLAISLAISLFFCLCLSSLKGNPWYVSAV